MLVRRLVYNYINLIYAKFSYTNLNVKSRETQILIKKMEIFFFRKRINLISVYFVNVDGLRSYPSVEFRERRERCFHDVDH